MDKSAINVLITGATGFVTSNIAKRILNDFKGARAVLLDINPIDPLVTTFFADQADRIDIVRADVSDTSCLAAALERWRFTHVIHAAAVTHDDSAEKHDPTRFINVNLNGTVALLEWMRTQKEIARFIHVSTGGVYGNPTEFSPIKSQNETGPFDPPELYAVSKFAAELIVRRYGQLYGLPQVRVRFADVFGPMERPTGARRPSSMSSVYRMMRAAIEKRPLRVSKRTLETRIDLTSAEDIAGGVVRLLMADDLPFDVYNIAAGCGVMMSELFDTFTTLERAFSIEICDANSAEIDYDPTNKLARYNVYDTARMGQIGWLPRPLSEQLKSYHSWVLEDPETRCKSLTSAPEIEERRTR